MNDIIKISKKEAAKGEERHKTFSVRIKDETLTALDELAHKSNRSRNELIGILLEFGISHCVIEDKNASASPATKPKVEVSAAPPLTKGKRPLL